ncbi:unnamed protein product [Phytophthora fragariaefolia]|uniref:Unnamed protein product n=1 Tax=Phytophthora fragariaefolia TaxID=1490495 RepID=A0A9W6XK77_9STRA|nr:unnamed protein product [Phytophthora fragariaefolia]
MEVSRHLDDDFRRFGGAVAPVGAALQRPAPKSCGARVLVGEIRLDVGVKTLQGQARRRSSMEDIRPASPLAGKPKAMGPVKPDGRVHPSWTEVEVESEPATTELPTVSGDRLHSFRADNAGSFRSMEVLTCFRSQARRGIRLLLKAAAAERWHMCWALLLSMLLLPVVLTLMVVASVGFVMLSTWAAVAAAVVYPLAYINPRLYSYATDS